MAQVQPVLGVSKPKDPVGSKQNDKDHGKAQLEASGQTVIHRQGALICNAALLFVLIATSFGARTYLGALFGKTFGPMYFYFSAFLAFLAGTFVLSGRGPDAQRNALLGVALFQGAVAAVGRPVGSFLGKHVEDPVVAAFAAHALLSFPALSMGGAVWLEWARQFTEPEVTWWGEQIFRVFSSIALVTVVKLTDPFIWETVIGIVDCPPQTLLVSLSFATLIISMAFTLDGSALRGQALTRTLTALSVLMLMTAASFVGRTRASTYALQYQRYSPAGFIQVVDDTNLKPPVRYLRLDASVLGEAFLNDQGEAVVTNGPSLLDAARLAEGAGIDRALVIGVQAGSAASSLIKHGFNTTILDERRILYDTVRSYFGLPEPAAVEFSDIAHWVAWTAARADPPLAEKDKFDVIVHDVFEGGEMPARLFTMEFWANVRALTKETGVLAVRYLGRPKDVTLKSAVNMLNKNFGACRIYHANDVTVPPLSAPGSFAEFVFFCTPSNSLEFRARKEEEEEGDVSAAALLPVIDTHELDAESILAGSSPDRYLLREQDPIINHWGRDGINEHWKLMRRRFPPAFWDNF